MDKKTSIDNDMMLEREIVAYGLISGCFFIDQEQYLSREIEISRKIVICPRPTDILKNLEPQQEGHLSKDMKDEIFNGMFAVKSALITNKKDESTKLKKVFDDIHKFISTLRIVKPNLAYPQFEFVFYPQENRYFLRTLSHLSSCYSSEMDLDGKDILLRKFDISLAENVKEIWDNIPQITVSRTRVWLAFGMNESAYREITNEFRILFFAIALECLFSTERRNLMHNLASRTARFLSDNIKMREKIYRRIIKAYEIRSMIVHGLKKPTAHCKYRFAEVVFRDMIRQCLEKIIKQKSLINIFTDQGQKVYNTFLKNLGTNTEHNLHYENGACWIPITNKFKIGRYCPQCWKKERIPIKMEFKTQSQKWRCTHCNKYIVCTQEKMNGYVER